LFQELKKIFENLHPLSDEEWNEISSYFKELKFDKGEIITKEGQVDIPEHTDPPDMGLKIDVKVHSDADFACHSGGC
jgi:hypothetical protein